MCLDITGLAMIIQSALTNVLGYSKPGRYNKRSLRAGERVLNESRHPCFVRACKYQHAIIPPWTLHCVFSRPSAQDSKIAICSGRFERVSQLTWIPPPEDVYLYFGISILLLEPAKSLNS